MNRELQQTGDNCRESSTLNFSQRDQLVSGFNDLPSNHSVDQTFNMGRGGELTFAPMVDDNLASSVLGDGLFQKGSGTTTGADKRPGGIFSVPDTSFGPSGV